MNIFEPLRKVKGPRPLCGVRNTAKLGCWHPSTTDIILSRIVDSHPLLILPFCERVIASTIAHPSSTVNAPTLRNVTCYAHANQIARHLSTTPKDPSAPGVTFPSQLRQITARTVHGSETWVPSLEMRLPMSSIMTLFPKFQKFQTRVYPQHCSTKFLYSRPKLPTKWHGHPLIRHSFSLSIRPQKRNTSIQYSSFSKVHLVSYGPHPLDPTKRSNSLYLENESRLCEILSRLRALTSEGNEVIRVEDKVYEGLRCMRRHREMERNRQSRCSILLQHAHVVDSTMSTPVIWLFRRISHSSRLLPTIPSPPQPSSIDRGPHEACITSPTRDDRSFPKGPSNRSRQV